MSPHPFSKYSLMTLQACREMEWKQIRARQRANTDGEASPSTSTREEPSGQHRLDTSVHIKDPNQSSPSLTFTTCADLLFGGVMAPAWSAVTAASKTYFWSFPHMDLQHFHLLWTGKTCQRVDAHREFSLYRPIALLQPCLLLVPVRMLCSSRQRWTIPDLGRVLTRKDPSWPNKKGADQFQRFPRMSLTS